MENHIDHNLVRPQDREYWEEVARTRCMCCGGSLGMHFNTCPLDGINNPDLTKQD